MRLETLGEFQFIDFIRQQAPTDDHVCRGIGDDAAVLALPQGHQLVTSTDMLVESVHFQHDWISKEDLGHKAVAVNLSDLAAMGGQPRFLYLGLALPVSTEVAEIKAFLKGCIDEASKYHVNLVGGDTCKSPGPWFISVTLEGTVPKDQDIGRNGARPGDLIMVSGTLGDSALALNLLTQDRAPGQELLAKHNRPTPRIELGRRLGAKRLVSAMIDISDGLAGDLDHILQASGVDGIIQEAQLPLSKTFKAHVKKNPAIKEMALSGGEDYELLFTTAPSNEASVMALAKDLGLQVTTIGSVKKGNGVLEVQDRKGSSRPVAIKSYDHFCRS